MADNNELGELEQVDKGAEAPKPDAPAEAAAPAGEQSAADFSFDMGDLQGPGVEVIDIGKKVSRLPVERVKFSATHQALISIVTKGAIAVKTHYRENFGNYFCLGSGKACCEKDGLPRVKYVFPICIYDVDDDFRIRSSKLQFKVLSVGQEQYDAISNIAKLNGDLTTMDLAVQCSDERYQKCTYTFAGQCRWRKGAKTAAMVKDFWTKNKDNILLPIAMKKTEEQILAKPEAAGNEPGGPLKVETSDKGGVNFDNVFN